MEEKARAAEGVGCIINKNWEDKIINWTGWSERILTVELEMQEKEKITLIAVYGPDENEKKEVKDKFWEDLALITERSKGKIFVAGDFNSRVGKRENNTETVIGKFGEDKRNNNGNRLIEYCSRNNLIITNSFFQHKKIHTITREVKSRNERSILEYILVEKNNRQVVKDVRVKRGAEIYSDHYLLMGKIKRLENEKQAIRKEYAVQKETIRIYKLQEAEIAKKYENIIRMELLADEEKLEQMNLEEMWKKIKNTLINAARNVCGVIKTNKYTKRTAWWSEEIKDQVKLKKKRWAEYLIKNTEEAYKTYKEQRTIVKRMVIDAKGKTWQDFGEKLEKNSRENQKLFYNVLKNLRKGKKPDSTLIKDNNGKVLSDPIEIMNRWRQYFQELLQTQGTNNEENTQTEDKQRQTENEEEGITEEELTTALNKMKNGKSPGHDRITGEMLKQMGKQGTKAFLKMFNKIWNEEIIPKDWEVGQIVPIFKKGDRKTCSNYRGITLLSIPLKLFEQTMEGKLRTVIEPTLTEEQSGFRKGRSVQDHIFTAKQIITKIHQYNEKAAFAFIDLEKAFDRTPRKRVWQNLSNRGVSPKVTRVIQSLYQKTRNYVINNNRTSEEFTTNEGLRQGGVLSPVLFNIFIDEIIRTCHQKIRGLHVGYRKLQPIFIRNCVFADDIIVMAGSEEELQRNLMIWNEELTNNGMKINANKTQVMLIGKDHQKIKIQINEQEIEQTKQFKYLGVTIDNDGRQEIDISERIEKCNKLYYTMNVNFINKREVSQKTKLTVYKTIFRPTMTYGCESWVLTQKMKLRLEATEMKYLRRVKGVSLRDKIRSSQIRAELVINPVTSFIEQKQLTWWGHLLRMDQDRQAKRIWETMKVGKRKRGRPQETWDNTIGKILARKGKTVEEAKTMTSNRKEWNKFVHNTDNTV